MTSTFFSAPWLLTLARVFQAAGAPLFAVGGSVRNALIGLPASDIDICGPARPEAVLAMCAGTAVTAVLRAAHFGTVDLHVADAEGRHMAEYTTFRVDSYRCGHQPVAVRFADSVEVDALRRDFSINALYRPLLPDPAAKAEVLDPTGGLAHLRQGILHTVTPDPDQVLKDDGLRILRAARFQAELGLTPTPALLASAKRFAPLLQDIAQERLRDELSKILLSDQKHPTLARTVPPITSGLQTVLQIGAWGYLFGSLAPDTTALAALAHYLAPNGVPALSGKLALLFRLETPDALAERMRLLRFSQLDIEAAATALSAMQRIFAGKLALMDAFRLGVAPVLHAAAALSALAQVGVPCDGELAQANALLESLRNAALPKSLKELAIHGDDLLTVCQALGIPPKVIGGVLDALWCAVVEQRLPNEPDALRQLAFELLTARAPAH